MRVRRLERVNFLTDRRERVAVGTVELLGVRERDVERPAGRGQATVAARALSVSGGCGSETRAVANASSAAFNVFGFASFIAFAMIGFASLPRASCTFVSKPFSGIAARASSGTYTGDLAFHSVSR